MNRTLLKQYLAQRVGAFAPIFIGVGAIYNNAPNAAVGPLVGGPVAGMMRSQFPIQDRK